jgi:hypothetical protein
MLSENQDSRKLLLRTFWGHVFRTAYIRDMHGLFVRLVHRIRRHFRIQGQAPTVQWKQNDFALERSINEALSIAQKYGVVIPEDVTFFVAEPGELKGSLRKLLSGQDFESARGPGVTEHKDGRIYWQDHFNKYGKIPFQIHPDILTSDEAIVAVFQHEMHELLLLRRVFMLSQSRTMDAADYGIQVSTRRPGNFHDQAWSEADKRVLRMRRASG